MIGFFNQLISRNVGWNFLWQKEICSAERIVLNGDSSGSDASEMVCPLLGLAVVQVVILDVFQYRSLPLLKSLMCCFQRYLSGYCHPNLEVARPQGDMKLVSGIIGRNLPLSWILAFPGDAPSEQRQIKLFCRSYCGEKNQLLTTKRYINASRGISVLYLQTLVLYYSVAAEGSRIEVKLTSDPLQWKFVGFEDVAKLFWPWLWPRSLTVHAPKLTKE